MGPIQRSYWKPQDQMRLDHERLFIHSTTDVFRVPLWARQTGGPQCTQDKIPILIELKFQKGWQAMSKSSHRYIISNSDRYNLLLPNKPSRNLVASNSFHLLMIPWVGNWGETSWSGMSEIHAMVLGSLMLLPSVGRCYTTFGWGCQLICLSCPPVASPAGQFRLLTWQLGSMRAISYCSSTYQASAWVTLSNVPMTKANQMAKPRIAMRGDNMRAWNSLGSDHQPNNLTCAKCSEENQNRVKREKINSEEGALTDRVVRKVTFEQRPKGSKTPSHVKFWRQGHAGWREQRVKTS